MTHAGGRWVLLAALGLSASAGANIGAVRPDPAVGSSVRATDTAIVVLSEALSFECEDERGHPSCAFSARYLLDNPTAEPQTAVIAFYGEHASTVELRLDGRAVGRPLKAAEVAALDRRTGLTRSGHDQQTRDGAEVTVAAGQHAELVATGRLAPGRPFVPSYSKAALETRHPLLASEVPRSNVFELEYLVAPIRSWAGQPPHLTVTLGYPRDWKVALAAVAGEGTEALEAIDGRVSLDAQQVDVLQLKIEPTPQRVFNGGYLLGLGGTLGSGFRMRMGYEIAAPEWLLLSLCAETDFRRALTVVPLVHAASDELLSVIPSLSAGLGVPVQVLPEARVGVRAQVTASWAYLGFVAALDVFPGASQVTRWTLLGQVGL